MHTNHLVLVPGQGIMYSTSPSLPPNLSYTCTHTQVILSQEQKQLIFSTVSNFEAYKRCRRKMGLDDTITYGAGMVLLFYGSPGTGKTMMANALANKLKKKVRKLWSSWSAPIGKYVHVVWANMCVCI